METMTITNGTITKIISSTILKLRIYYKYMSRILQELFRKNQLTRISAYNMPNLVISLI